MYKKYSTSLKEEQKNLQVKTNNIKNLINKEENEIQSLKENKEKISTLINKFYDLNDINTEVISEFIEKISIDKNRNFHINLKFKI